MPIISKPLRSLDAEHLNQATMIKTNTCLLTTFERSWRSHTVQTVMSRLLQKGNYYIAYKQYEEIRCADLGTPLDTHPLEDVQKAVKIVSQYSEMIHSYAQLLDTSSFGEWNKRRYSDCLHSTLQRDELMTLVGFLAGLNHFGLLEKYCKWSTASLWAWGLKQTELPPIPNAFEHPLCSPFKSLFINKKWRERFCATAKVRRNARDFLAIFLKDLYNCKAAASAVGPEFIQNALKTHKEILTTPKVAPIPIGSDQGDDYLLTSITEAAENIFGPVRKLNRLAPSRFPSLNSSYSSRIVDGGAGGEILRECADLDDFYMLQPEDGYFYGFATYKSRHFEVRTPYDPEVWYEAEQKSEQRAIFKAISGYGVDAQVVPLSEPFKVRTITKGDSDMYHLARRWQKVIHSRMRKDFQSSLIGQPCSAAYLAQVFYNSPRFNYSETSGFFVSGDYESATDLLNPELSVWAQNEISSRLGIPLEHQRVLNACLTEHNLYYGEKGEDGRKITYRQTWGQLMGSPVSFPVLCLINLAATKLAYELYETERLKSETKVTIPISELPMCVNGDDILFWCHSDRHYQIWKDVTANAGLKFSLGKNYTSRRFCIINSEMYRHQPTTDLKFEKIPCINTRLLEGGSRSSVTTHFRVHPSDFKTLVADPLFDRKTHLKRFCRDDPKKTALLCLQHEHGDRSTKALVWQEYASWFNTIEQRRTVLHNQATHARLLWYTDSKSNNQITNGQREIQVKEICDKRFADVQMRRLNEFRALLGNRLGQSISYDLPQSLGGFGFPKRAGTGYTVEDVKTATLSYLQPRRFAKAVSQHTPKLAKAGFMSMINREISFITKHLEVEEVSEIKQYASYKVDDDSIYELSFLSGFLSTTNLCVDIDERESAAASRFTHGLPLQRVHPALNKAWNKMSTKVDAIQLATDLKNEVERIEVSLIKRAEKGYRYRSEKPVPKMR
nr:MAG: putative RNA-dependent RNA polymerase [Narnaviridae sp.]